MIVEYSENFFKEAKKLSKKFKMLKSDLKEAIVDLEERKDFGVSLGYGLFKKRVSNSSIPTGKSGGFRIIIYEQVEDKIVLISIYSKTQKDTLSDDELKTILKEHMEK